MASLGVVRFGAREREILGLPAFLLRIVAAGKVPEAARLDVSDLAVHVHDDERVGVPATQPTVLAPGGERSPIEAIAVPH